MMNQPFVRRRISSLASSSSSFDTRDSKVGDDPGEGNKGERETDGKKCSQFVQGKTASERF